MNDDKKATKKKKNVGYIVAQSNRCSCRWNVQLCQHHEPGCADSYIPPPLESIE